MGKERLEKLKQMIGARIVNKILDISDFEVIFKFGIFLRTFIYHLIFFTFGIPGSVCVIVVDGVRYAKNMLFIGCNMFVFMQNSQQMAFATLLILFFIFEPVGFTIPDLLFPILTIVTRSLIIGIRYGYMSDSRYKVMKVKQTINWVIGDLVVPNWDRVPFESATREIQATKYRVKIEDDDFSFQFLKPLSKDMHEKLLDENYYTSKNLSMKDVVKEIKGSKKEILKEKRNNRINPKKGTLENKDTLKVNISKASDMNIINPTSKADRENTPSTLFFSSRTLNKVSLESESGSNTEYKGDLLLREIAILDQVETPSIKLAKYTVITRTVLYILLQIPNLQIIADYTAVDYIILVCLMYVGITVHLPNLIFVVMGLIDFRRKLFYQKVMSALINPERKPRDPAYMSLVPAINITD